RSGDGRRFRPPVHHRVWNLPGTARHRCPGHGDPDLLRRSPERRPSGAGAPHRRALLLHLVPGQPPQRAEGGRGRYRSRLFDRLRRRRGQRVSLFRAGHPARGRGLPPRPVDAGGEPGDQRPGGGLGRTGAGRVDGALRRQRQGRLPLWGVLARNRVAARARGTRPAVRGRRDADRQRRVRRRRGARLRPAGRWLCRRDPGPERRARAARGEGGSTGRWVARKLQSTKQPGDDAVLAACKRRDGLIHGVSVGIEDAYGPQPRTRLRCPGPVVLPRRKGTQYVSTISYSVVRWAGWRPAARAAAISSGGSRRTPWYEPAMREMFSSIRVPPRSLTPQRRLSVAASSPIFTQLACRFRIVLPSASREAAVC